MISFSQGSEKFNFRLGAVILNCAQTKVLLHTIAGYDFYLLPGGRLEFMESCYAGICRELHEELGLKEITPRLVATVENFFTFKSVNFHEISQNFCVILDEKTKWLERDERMIGKEGSKYIFQWVNIADLDRYEIRPPILRQIITNHFTDNQHYVLDER